MVRQWFAKPSFVGSNPSHASRKLTLQNMDYETIKTIANWSTLVLIGILLISSIVTIFLNKKNKTKLLNKLIIHGALLLFVIGIWGVLLYIYTPIQNF